MQSDILILGGGFGGLETATTLRTNLDERFQITLIDRKDYFAVGFTKLDLMFGRRTMDDIKAYYSALPNKGINFVQDEIVSINPNSRSVRTKSAAFECEYLIIALGAELVYDTVPGFEQDGHSFYSVDGAERLRPVLESFGSGNILISVFDNPYSCPPAPYEAAFLMHDYLTEKGIRDSITIKTLAPTPIPLPIAKEASGKMVELLSEHDIEFLPQHKVVELLPEKKQAMIEGRDNMDYDLFIGVPKHVPPKVIRESQLVDGGFVPVDRHNLSTRFENVYAIGDVTGIPVGDLAVPKSGAFAEDGGRAVAKDILNRIKAESNPVTYHAVGTCFFEVGSGKLAKVDGNILGHPEPQMIFSTPTEEYRSDKVEFETSRIEKWFG